MLFTFSQYISLIIFYIFENLIIPWHVFILFIAFLEYCLILILTYNWTNSVCKLHLLSFFSLPRSIYTYRVCKCPSKVRQKSLKFALSLLQIYVNYLTCYNWYIKWFKSLPMRQHKQKSIEKKAKAQKAKAKAKKANPNPQSPIYKLVYPTVCRSECRSVCLWL